MSMHTRLICLAILTCVVPNGLLVWECATSNNWKPSFAPLGTGLMVVLLVITISILTGSAPLSWTSATFLMFVPIALFSSSVVSVAILFDINKRFSGLCVSSYVLGAAILYWL